MTNAANLNSERLARNHQQGIFFKNARQRFRVLLIERKNIGDSALASRSSLREVIIDKGIPKIRRDAAAECRQLLP